VLQQPSELLWLSGRRLRKRDGGQIVATLLRLLRFAWVMHHADTTTSNNAGGSSNAGGSGSGSGSRKSLLVPPGPAGTGSWRERLAEVCSITRKGGGDHRLDLLLAAAQAEDRTLLPANAVR
jgi:hypothetical protein